MYLVESISLEFEKHCQSAKDNLLLASLRIPVYGSLLAIHELLIRSVDEMKNSKHIRDWKKLLERLIKLCFGVSQVVSPIAFHLKVGRSRHVAYLSSYTYTFNNL